MIPGEMFIKDGDIELNKGRKTVTLSVANTGDRPIQVVALPFLRDQSGAPVRSQEGARHAV
jgi:urease beta subunit